MQLSPNRECLLAADCLHACTRDFRSRHRPSASRRRTPRIFHSVALALRRERFRGLFACEQIRGGVAAIIFSRASASLPDCVGLWDKRGRQKIHVHAGLNYPSRAFRKLSALIDVTESTSPPFALISRLISIGRDKEGIIVCQSETPSKLRCVNFRGSSRWKEGGKIINDPPYEKRLGRLAALTSLTLTANLVETSRFRGSRRITSAGISELPLCTYFPIMEKIP